MKAQFLLCWTLLLSVVSANEPQNGPTDHPGLARQWTGQHKGVSAAPNCADTDPNCPDWALAGECTINPRYMLTACRKSCKQCAAPNFLLTLAREIAAIKLLLSSQAQVSAARFNKINDDIKNIQKSQAQSQSAGLTGAQVITLMASPDFDIVKAYDGALYLARKQHVKYYEAKVNIW